MNTLKKITLALILLTNMACLEEDLVKSLGQITAPQPSRRPIIVGPVEEESKQESPQPSQSTGETPAAQQTEPAPQIQESASSPSASSISASPSSQVPSQTNPADPSTSQPQTGSTTAGNPQASPEPTPTNGTSTASNPTLMLNLEDADLLLLLPEDNNNFVRYVDNQYLSIFEYADPDIGVATLVRYSTVSSNPPVIPAVTGFIQGPYGDLVVTFENKVTVSNGQKCKGVYFNSTENSSLCLPQDFPDLQNLTNYTFKFDDLGHLYHGKKSYRTFFNKIDLSSSTTSSVSIPGIDYFLRWDIHANGEIYASGKFDANFVNSANMKFFVRINTDGSLENPLPANSQVSDFIFVSPSRMILAGNVSGIPSNSGYYLFNFSGIGSPVARAINYASGFQPSLQSYQQSDTGDFFAFNYDHSKIICFYPCQTFEVENGLDMAGQFQIVGNSIYISGTVGYDNIIIKKELYSDEAPQNLTVNVEGIQIFNFKVAGGILYYNGLNYASNSWAFGMVDIDTLEHTILDEDMQFLQMENLEPYRNATFE